MSEVQDELERLRLKFEINKIVYGAAIYAIRESSGEAIEPTEAVERLVTLFDSYRTPQPEEPQE